MSREIWRLYQQQRVRKQELRPADLGDDEPDWSPPTDADLAWAQSTMPGKASGHTVGWRVWHARREGVETLVDRSTTAELAQLSDTELCDRLAQMQREIIDARNTPPYILRSGNDARWEPGKPICGYFHEGMPRAHGAGIYAMKECPNHCLTGVVGKVALWGSVVEHTSGYRARYAYPLELWCEQEEVATALAHHYGVTSHVGMPEGMHIYDSAQYATQQLIANRQAMMNQAFGAGAQIFGTPRGVI